MVKQDLENHPGVKKLREKEEEAARSWREEADREQDKNQAFIHIVFYIICIIGIGGTIYSWLFG